MAHKVGSVVLALSACVAQQPPPARQPPEAPAVIAATPDAAVAGEDPRVVEERTIQAAKAKLAELGFVLYNPRHKDGKPFPPSEGYLAPVAPIAGGYLYSGVLGERLVIGRRDANGNVVWEITYEARGFVAYEGGQVGEDAAGNVLAFVPSYITEATNPVQRLVKLAPDGKILWELPLGRDRHGNSPQIHFGKLAADGSLYLQGHIYQGKPQKTDRPSLQWSATITPDGALTDEVIGRAIDWATDEW